MNVPKTFDPETGGCFSLKKKKGEKKKIINTLKHASFLSVALCDKVNKQRSGGCILALSTLNCQHSTWLCGGFADGSFLGSLMGHMRHTPGVSGRRAAVKATGGLAKGWKVRRRCDMKAGGSVRRSRDSEMQRESPPF